MTDTPHGEWLRLGQQNLVSAQLLVTQLPDAAPTVARFAVWAAEQALKAALVARGVRPHRTQELERLLQEVVDAGAPLGELADACRRLGPHLHRNCDPTDEAHANADDARVAVSDAQRVIEVTGRVIAQLGPAPERPPRTGHDSGAPPRDPTVIEAGLAAPISELVTAIVAIADPRRVIVFGSRVGGRPHAESDLDVMVEVDREVHPREEAMRVRRALGQRGVRLDLHVFTPAKVARQQGVHTSFLSEIEETGRVVYERAPATAANRTE